MPPNDLIRVSQAARILGVHVGCLYRWRDEGRITLWQVGSRYRVSEADVRELVRPAEPRARPAAPPAYSARAVRLRQEHTQRGLEAAGIRRPKAPGG